MEISEERLDQLCDDPLICISHEQREICRELLERRKADRTMEARIGTLLGVTCPRCEKGDALFVERDTGFYTHTLGGNYCSAHKLHSLLNTKQSQAARSKVPAAPEVSNG